MKQSTIAALQAIAATLQFINLGIGTVTRNPMVALIVGGAIIGLNVYLNKIGNSSVPQAALDHISDLQGTVTQLVAAPPTRQ